MYKYNGIRLPKLPEYNTEAYPYALIQRTKNDMGYTVYLRYSNQPFFLNTNTVTNTDGAEHFMRTLSDDKTAWGDETVSDVATLTLPSDTVVWCNVDIMDNLGELFLAASKSELVVAIDLKSLVYGINLRLAGRPLSIAKVERTLVAYLYNGVRMPSIPSDISDTYAHCMILKVSSAPSSTYNQVFQDFYNDYCTIGNYYLVASDGDFRYNTTYSSLDAGIGYYRFVYEFDTDSMSWNFVKKVGFTFHSSWWDLIWSGVDIFTGTDSTISDTLYFSGSDPVPVYE